MPGYKQLCRYCDGLIPPDSSYCPLCAKTNPLGSYRCPACRSPVKRNWKRCNNCGVVLETQCPSCGKSTFFGDYCDECEARLLVICPDPKCKTEQAPLKDTCIKCGKPLK